MKPKRVALVVGLLLLLGSADASAEDVQPLPGPHVKVTSGDAVITTVDEKKFLLPVGSHILDGTSYDKLSDDYKVQKDLAMRYKAENDSLKKHIASDGPGWGTMLVLTGLAIATGTVVYFVN